MKVIILCSNYEPGGAQRVSLRLEAALKVKGINASCWFFHRKSEDFSKDSPNILFNKKISNAQEVIRVISRLRKLINCEKPDAIISFLPYANTLGLIIAFIGGVKIRIASHRSESKEELSPVMRLIDYLCASLGVYTSVTAVSTTTKMSFSYYSAYRFNQIQVINNGLEYAYTNLSKESCRKFFNFKSQDYIIGTVGRLVPSKNHKLLIEILPFLEDIRLVIVGKGGLKQELNDLAKKLGVLDRFTIIDEVNTMNMPLFFKAIDLFMMPTLYEGLSNALIEALHAGLPIVSSDVPAQRDVLLRKSDGLEAGILVDVNNFGEWINAVQQLKNDEKYRKRFQENACFRSRDFTLEQMANGYISLLECKN